MTIPSLPTDNLYKFIALSGLLMVLVALIYPITILNKSNEKLNQLAGSKLQVQYELNEMHAKDTLIREKLKELEQSIGSSYDSVKQNIYSLAYNDSIKKLCQKNDFREYFKFIEKYKYSLFPNQSELKEIEDLMKEREDLRLEIKNLLIQLNYKSGELKTELELYERNKTIIIALLYSGIFITLSGFFLWYIKVQRYLDIKLKQETLKMLMENKKH